jgi:hypothetical protein
MNNFPNSKQKTCIIAIDPGVSGAMAKVENAVICEPLAFTTPVEAARWLQGFDPKVTTAWIEQVHSSPQMGVRSSFSFGQNFGFWIGALTALKIPIRQVKPQLWQRGIPGLNGKQGRARKTALKQEAQQRFPHFKVTYATADALLLADWARSQMTTHLQSHD